MPTEYKIRLSPSQVLNYLHVVSRGYFILLSGIQTGSCNQGRVPQSYLFYFSNSADTKSVFPACPQVRKKQVIEYSIYLTGSLLPFLYLSFLIRYILFTHRGNFFNHWAILTPLHTWELGCLGSSILPGDSLLALCLSVKGTTLPEGLNLLEEEQKGD